jgi:hypothetical protein
MAKHRPKVPSDRSFRQSGTCGKESAPKLSLTRGFATRHTQICIHHDLASTPSTNYHEHAYRAASAAFFTAILSHMVKMRYTGRLSRNLVCWVALNSLLHSPIIMQDFVWQGCSPFAITTAVRQCRRKASQHRWWPPVWVHVAYLVGLGHDYATPTALAIHTTGPPRQACQVCIRSRFLQSCHRPYMRYD